MRTRLDRRQSDIWRRRTPTTSSPNLTDRSRRRRRPRSPCPPTPHIRQTCHTHPSHTLKSPSHRTTTPASSHLRLQTSPIGRTPPHPLSPPPSPNIGHPDPQTDANHRSPFSHPSPPPHLPPRLQRNGPPLPISPLHLPHRPRVPARTRRRPSLRPRQTRGPSAAGGTRAETGVGIGGRRTRPPRRRRVRGRP